MKNIVLGMIPLFFDDLFSSPFLLPTLAILYYGFLIIKDFPTFLKGLKSLCGFVSNRKKKHKVVFAVIAIALLMIVAFSMYAVKDF